MFKSDIKGLFSRHLILGFLSSFILCKVQAECAFCASLNEAYQVIAKKLDAKQSVSKGLVLDCFDHLDDRHAVGVIQRFVIHAELKTVQNVLEDFESYKDLFAETVRVEADKQNPFEWLITWTQSAPVIFASRPQHELYYKISSEPKAKIYRTSLKKSTHLIYSQGLIKLVELDSQNTLYFESDFYNANWGLAKIEGTKSLFERNIKELVQTDIALKIKSENPLMPSREAQKKVDLKIYDSEIQKCVEQKLAFSKEQILKSLQL